MTTLCMNLKLLAVTQMKNFEFESHCNLDGNEIVSNNSGLLIIGGDKDNGVDIDSSFMLALSDWGITNAKRIRSLFFGMETDGSINVIVEDDEDNHTEHLIEYNEYQRVGSNKCNPGRNNNCGRYFNVGIENVDGSYFVIRQIDVLPIILNRSPK